MGSIRPVWIREHDIRQKAAVGTVKRRSILTRRIIMLTSNMLMLLNQVIDDELNERYGLK